MIAILLLSLLAFVGCTSSGSASVPMLSPSIKEASACAALVEPLRTIHATVTQGGQLTPQQSAQLRQWNDRCQAPEWQAALGTVPARPLRTWRDDAIQAIRAFERGATVRITSCRTTYAQRGSWGGYYTTCTTH